TYDTPLKVPLHPPQDVECVSRGTEESRLLREILAQATQTHPPEYRGAPSTPGSSSVTKQSTKAQ
ncbi:MAG TPA: hypothetical protein VEJ86_06060, partial [Candidatus Binataceae bacterium]|nr:hypothetical protein [Candidatus Binataceae bacterium]